MLVDTKLVVNILQFLNQVYEDVFNGIVGFLGILDNSVIIVYVVIIVLSFT